MGLSIHTHKTTQHWQIGQAFNDLWHIEDVISIYAYDAELQHIRDLFGSTIPLTTNAEYMTWYGDIAKTILAAL